MSSKVSAIEKAKKCSGKQEERPDIYERGRERERGRNERRDGFVCVCWQVDMNIFQIVHWSRSFGVQNIV